MFNGYWIQILAQDILTDISIAQDKGVCRVNFLPSVDDFWVFGNIIYKNYYVYHNLEKGVLGWTPSTNRLKSPLIKASQPSNLLKVEEGKNNMLVRILVVIIVQAVTVSITIFIFTTSFSGISFLN